MVLVSDNHEYLMTKATKINLIDNQKH